MSDMYMDFVREAYDQMMKYGRLLWNNLNNRLVKLLVMASAVILILFLLFMLLIGLYAWVTGA